MLKSLLRTLTKHTMLLSSDEEDIEQMYQLKITIMIVSFIFFFFFWCLEKFGPNFRVSISMSIHETTGNS